MEPSTEENWEGIRPRLIVILGPTASGKTSLSLKIAKFLSSIVINADAFQVYRGFSVAVDKIQPSEMEGVPHFGLDLVDPEKEFTVKDFLNYAIPIIDRELSSGRSPIVVGGTHMYLEKLLFTSRLDQDEVANPSHLPQEPKDLSYEHLMSIDPEMAERVHRNDWRRVSRAISYYYETGLRLSDSLRCQTRKLRWDNILVISTEDPSEDIVIPGKKKRKIDMDPTRVALESKIRTRIEEKMLRGDRLKTELMKIKEMLIENRLEWNKGILQAIGYREFEAYLSDMMQSGSCNERLFTDGVNQLILNTLRFSKKQRKWLRKLASMIQIFHSDQIHELLRTNQSSQVKFIPLWDSR